MHTRVTSQVCLSICCHWTVVTAIALNLVSDCAHIAGSVREVLEAVCRHSQWKTRFCLGMCVCVCVFVHVYTLDYVWVWMNLCMCVRERRSAMIITDSFLHIFVVAYHPREWRCLLCEWSCRIAGSIQAKLRFYCRILSKCSPVNILANLKYMHRYGSVPS